MVDSGVTLNLFSWLPSATEGRVAKYLCTQPTMQLGVAMYFSSSMLVQKTSYNLAVMGLRGVFLGKVLTFLLTEKWPFF